MTQCNQYSLKFINYLKEVNVFIYKLKKRKKCLLVKRVNKCSLLF